MKPGQHTCVSGEVTSDMAGSPGSAAHKRGLYCVIAIVVIVIGFAIAELAIFVGGQYKPLAASTQCDEIPLPSNATFSFEKQLLSRWHWRYVGQDDIDGKFQQRCPSLTHDAELTLNGNVAGRTDGKIATVVSSTRVLDCHGDTVFTWDTGSVFQTVINSFRLSVRYLIYDGVTGSVLAYVDGTQWISSDDISILSAIDLAPGVSA